MREDIPVAKQVFSQEEARAQYERMRQLEEQRRMYVNAPWHLALLPFELSPHVEDTWVLLRTVGCVLSAVCDFEQFKFDEMIFSAVKFKVDTRCECLVEGENVAGCS